MDRTCAACGEPFQAIRKTATFCSDRCRKRARRASGPVKPPTKPVQTEALEPPTHESGLLAATRRRLTEAGVVDTVEGQAALVLAVRIETGMADSGSAVAALSRELRAVMDAALKSSAPAGNLIDELRAQREKRRTSA